MRNPREDEWAKVEMLQRKSEYLKAKSNLRLAEIRKKYCSMTPRDDELTQEETQQVTMLRIDATHAEAELTMAVVELQEACDVPTWARLGPEYRWRNPETGKEVVDEPVKLKEVSDA